MKHMHTWMLCVGMLGLTGCGGATRPHSQNDEDAATTSDTPGANVNAGDTQVTAATVWGAYISECHFTSSRGGGVSCTGAVDSGTAPYSYFWKKNGEAWTQGTLTQTFTCTSDCTLYFKVQDVFGTWYEDSPVVCSVSSRTCTWVW